MNRRTMLTMGGAALFAAPFYRLLTESAKGQATGAARRLLVFFSPNGTIPQHWRPNGSGSDFSFAEGSILEPLAELKNDLVLIDGMDFNVGDNHEGGMANMLTCGGQQSIDQLIADHIGDDTRFRSIELSALTSAWGGSAQTRMVYRAGSFVTPDDDPIHAWSRIFGGQVEDTEGPKPDPRTPERRLSLLDVHQTELQQLQARLGATERARLEVHLDSMRRLERALTLEGSCEQPIMPKVPGSPQDNDRFPDVVKAQIDLAIQALACEATRVASVQLSHTVSPVVFTWVGESAAHHELSHADDNNTGGIQSFVNCERWVAEQFGYLVQRMKEVPDAATGQPLLDDTMVIWVKELGDSRAHVTKSVPWVFAGPAGGAVDPGRLVRFDGTHDAVLTEVAQAFGVELESFGAGRSGPAGVLR